jgi:putative ABC transport system permease protein
MPAVGRFGRQLRSWLWRDPIADQVDAELDFHLEMLTRELIERGLSPDAARTEARLRFGDRAAVNAACRKIGLGHERDQRRTEFLAELRQDAVHALRQLRRAPAFTAVALLTLILAIAANTAIYSAVSAVLLRPLPYPDAGRLVVLWASTGDQDRNLVSYPDLQEWRARNRTFADIGLARSQSVNYTGADRPDRLIGSFVTANTLRLLGVHAAVGRLFADDETAEGTGARVAVLSNAAWQSRFGADPRAIGRTIVLNGRPHVVIGVTAADYTDPFGPMEVWLPVTSAPNANWLTRDNPNLWAVGLLKPGVTRAQAHADLSAIAKALAAEFPATNAGVGASVIPLREFLVGDARPTLLILLGFVALILLIACANIANLQLARSTSRRREMSLRAALGAGRARLVRQLLTESVVLAAIGGACGILLARWAIVALVAAAPGGLPALGPVGLDGPVLLFSAAITVAAGLMFGALPARWAARAGLAEALQTRTGDGAAPGRGDARTIFVAVQLALCIVLLVGAGLLSRSLARIRQTPLGFEPGQLLTAEFRLPSAKYTNDTAIAQFAEHTLERIRAVPGIRSAALLGSVPLSGNWGTTSYQPEGQAPPRDGVPPTTQVNFATDGFFGTMRMPVLKGRDFTPADRLGSPPVALVSEELARLAWPGRSPLGERLRIAGPPEVVATVVGVVGNVRQFTLTEPPTPQLYLAKAQNPGIFSSVVARTDGDPDALGDALRAAIWSVDPDQPVWKIRSMESLVARDLSPKRFTAALSGAFAVLALLLAVIGVYGVMSYAVAQRTREIGIRMALGAGRGEVERMVLWRGLQIVAVATVLGLAAAYGAARLIASQLFGVPPTDGVTFVAVPLGLAAVAMVACWLPARRAARVDPVIALQGE